MRMGRRGFTEDELWVEHDGQRIYGRLFLPEGLAEGRSIRDLVPGSVADYIEANGLYRNKAQGGGL